MNKTFLIMVVGLLVFSMAGVSAVSVPASGTIVGGVVYNNVVTIPNASVSISCNHNGLVSNKYTSTVAGGVYSVGFSGESCSHGDNVTVIASKGKLSGSSSGLVMDGSLMNLPVDISFRNVFMTPEFSFYMGLLTLIAAVGVFFVVRKD